MHFGSNKFFFSQMAALSKKVLFHLFTLLQGRNKQLDADQISPSKLLRNDNRFQRQCTDTFDNFCKSSPSLNTNIKTNIWDFSRIEQCTTLPT